MNEALHTKKLFEISENNENPHSKIVPPLNLCISPRVKDSKVDPTSLSNRVKKRNQVHKSLDFNLPSCQILTPRVIKADHTILSASTPKSLTSRKAGFGSIITVNNRPVAKNLFLDSFPV